MLSDYSKAAETSFLCVTIVKVTKKDKIPSCYVLNGSKIADVPKLAELDCLNRQFMQHA